MTGTCQHFTMGVEGVKAGKERCVHRDNVEAEVDLQSRSRIRS